MNAFGSRREVDGSIGISSATDRELKCALDQRGRSVFLPCLPVVLVFCLLLLSLVASVLLGGTRLLRHQRRGALRGVADRKGGVGAAYL